MKSTVTCVVYLYTLSELWICDTNLTLNNWLYQIQTHRNDISWPQGYNSFTWQCWGRISIQNTGVKLGTIAQQTRASRLSCNIYNLAACYMSLPLISCSFLWAYVIWLNFCNNLEFKFWKAGNVGIVTNLKRKYRQ